MKASVISFYAICLLALVFNGCMENRQSSANNSPVNNSMPEESAYSSTDHPVVNVYLENSGSMNGYVDNGKTMFQQDVYNYLADIKISGIPSELNLFFINSEIIPKGSVIDDFINKLTPNSFRISGGNTGTTDMADIFKKILERTSNDTISVFVSDCIFSPGNIASPEAYLVNQQIGIKESVAQHVLTHPDFGVMVYQLYSNFDGRYYDYQNRAHLYKGERPYYIWVMGSIYNLGQMRNAISDNQFRGGVSNFWFASSMDIGTTKYSILPSPRKGTFDRSSTKAEISKMKADDKGDFMFTIGADMKLLELLLGKDYLMDTNNYARLVNKQLSDEIYIEIARNENAKQPATHNISLILKNPIPKGEINLVLLRQIPSWAEEFTDDDDRNLTETNAKKTYGLKYLFDGIHQALIARASGYYTEMNINLK